MSALAALLVRQTEQNVEQLRALFGRSDVPPDLVLAEALEDAANLFLELSEEISAAERGRRAAATQPPAA